MSKTRNASWVDAFDDIMSLKQPFYSIEVNLEDSHSHHLIQLFGQLTSQHGGNARELIIHNAEFKSPKDFCEILRHVPKLEFLELSRTNFKLSEDDDPSSMTFVKLKHLKTIKVVYSSWIFFRFLMGSQITSLVVSTAQVRPAELESLVNFLELSKSLESIEMDREAFERIFQLGFLKSFSFKLKRFKFFSYTFKSEKDHVDENFIKFLELQSETLEELGLEYSSRAILQTIFTKLTNLRKLRLNSNSLPTDAEFYEQLMPIVYLREFEADDRVPSAIVAKGILKNCPNLEVLMMECDPNDVISAILPFIAQNNPKIKTLQVDSLKCEQAAEAKFQFLEAFHVFLFKEEDVLLSFIKNNPSLKTLNVKWVYEKRFIDRILPILLQETSITHLVFGGKSETMTNIREKIKSDPKHLRSLELNFKTDSVVKTLLYKYPEETLAKLGQLDLASKDDDFDIE